MNIRTTMLRFLVLALLAMVLASAPTAAAATVEDAAAASPQAAPDAAAADTLLGDQRWRILRRDIMGAWAAKVGSRTLVLELRRGGRFVMGEIEGGYCLVNDRTLVLMVEHGKELTYQVELGDDKLTLSGGDLEGKPLEFARAVRADSVLDGMFDFSELSGRAARRTTGRICTVLLGAFVLRVVIGFLKLLSRVVIYSQWGPLKFFYRSRKNRSMTLHLLTLNVVKYGIYLVAAGFILTELGVNYAAYLASVSVIGLAIAFGAQGLVQDMVTGLLIILEGQFDVGDMVDIPPHTGVVQELGLRMTRLRNYLGQQVVIPNRAISAVANYRQGAQESFIDVSVGDAEAAEKAAAIMTDSAGDIARQFSGVILRKPEPPQRQELDAGEHLVVRQRLSIWPGQAWVIDAQFVPRLRESLKAAGVEPIGDRVAVFYHLAADKKVPDLLGALGLSGRRAARD